MCPACKHLFLLVQLAVGCRLQRFVSGAAAVECMDCKLVLKVRMTDVMERCVRGTEIAAARDDLPRSSWARIELLVIE